ncbi:MAG: MFS transporter [Candidatus Heimdallarchaeota archaeon]|nr:MFS transporter [Candidatus Heimdallarchaeota archaeon]
MEEEIVPPGRRQTQAVINLANIIDYADAQIDISIYKPVRDEFGLSATELGAITAVRAVLQSIATPFWGVLADKYSRKKILAFGTFFWGIVTILVGFSQSYNQMLLTRGINGIALAIITPVTYSLIADYFKPEERGKAFGLLGLTTVIGALLGTLYATTISEGPKIMGFEGWRFAYFSFGAISILLGFLVLLFAKDPIRGGTEEGFIGKGVGEEYQVGKSHFIDLLKTKTFILIVAQGMVGALPWSAIGFLIYWLQLIGFEGGFAAIIYGLLAVGAAFGNLFGGYMGDKAMKWNPDHGRLYVAMISIFSGIPLTLILFQLVPASTDSLPILLVVGVFMGFSISWVAPAANNPILGEIIEPEARSTSYSMQRLFEGTFAAFGTLIVGYLADTFFGFIDKNFEELTEAEKTINVEALSSSMTWVLVVGWSLCFIIYSFLLKTYTKDRDRIRTVMINRMNQQSN